MNFKLTTFLWVIIPFSWRLHNCKNNNNIHSLNTKMSLLLYYWRSWNLGCALCGKSGMQAESWERDRRGRRRSSLLAPKSSNWDARTSSEKESDISSSCEHDYFTIQLINKLNSIWTYPYTSRTRFCILIALFLNYNYYFNCIKS